MNNELKEFIAKSGKVLKDTKEFFVDLGATIEREFGEEHPKAQDPSAKVRDFGTAKTDIDAELMSYFRFDHLPTNLQLVSKPFALLAQVVMDSCPACSQRTKALEKLVESKDCAVRAALSKG